MPRYELMYILASSVSDDQVPTTTKEIETIVSDFHGTEITHELMGKKKLAYQIGKTRNGHYGLLTFDMAGKDIAPLDTKIRTQKATIIRHLIINIDEHLERMEKDKIAQSKIKRTPGLENTDNTIETPRPVIAEKKAPAAPVTNEELDQEIEKALNKDVI